MRVLYDNKIKKKPRAVTMEIVSFLTRIRNNTRVFNNYFIVFVHFFFTASIRLVVSIFRIPERACRPQCVSSRNTRCYYIAFEITRERERELRTILRRFVFHTNPIVRYGNITGEFEKTGPSFFTAYECQVTHKSENRVSGVEFHVH